MSQMLSQIMKDKFISYIRGTITHYKIYYQIVKKLRRSWTCRERSWSVFLLRAERGEAQTIMDTQQKLLNNRFRLFWNRSTQIKR